MLQAVKNSTDNDFTMYGQTNKIKIPILSISFFVSLFLSSSYRNHTAIKYHQKFTYIGLHTYIHTHENKSKWIQYKQRSTYLFIKNNTVTVTSQSTEQVLRGLHMGPTSLGS